MFIPLFKETPPHECFSADDSMKHHQLKIWHHLSLLFIVIFGTYYFIIIRGDFIALDDMNLMTRLLNDSSFDLKSIFFPQHLGSYYRPLLELSYKLDHFIWFDVASGWHLTNVIFHCLNTVLVYLITRILFADSIREKALAAFYTALLYGINPLSTETVCWVSGRSELLAAFFMLFSFYLYLIFKMESSYGILLLSGLVFLLAATAKETALALPALIIAYEIIFKQSFFDNKRSVFLAVGYFLLLIVFYFYYLRPIVTVNLSLMHIGLGSSGLRHVSSFENVEVLFASFGFYAKKMFIPYPLNFAIHSINLIFYSILGIIVLILSAVFIRYSRSTYKFIVLWILITVSPAIAAAVLHLPWVLWAERYLYLPLVGFSMALGLCFTLISRQRFVQIFVLTLLIVLFWSTSLQRVYLWADEVRLWEDTAQHSQYGMVNYFYGKALLMNNHESEGIEQLKIAIARRYSLDPYLTLSDLEINNRDYKESELWLKKAARDFPQNIEVHRRLAENYLWRTSEYTGNDGFLMKAIDEYKKCVAVRKDDAAIYLKIAQLYRVAHQEQHATPFLERVIKIDNGSFLAQTAMKYLQETKQSGITQ
jgi:protein O-mannosyl-transferase